MTARRSARPLPAALQQRGAAHGRVDGGDAAAGRAELQPAQPPAAQPEHHRGRGPQGVRRGAKAGGGSGGSTTSPLGLFGRGARRVVSVVLLPACTPLAERSAASPRSDAATKLQSSYRSVRAHPGRPSPLSVLRSKLLRYVAFVWVRAALKQANTAVPGQMRDRENARKQQRFRAIDELDTRGALAHNPYLPARSAMICTGNTSNTRRRTSR